MLEFLARVFRRPDHQEQLRDALRQPITSCPVCSNTLQDHMYWDIASAEVGSEAEAATRSAIERRDWQKAAEYQRANALQDIRAWRAVKCTTGRISIVPVILTFEIWDHDRADAPIILDQRESDNLAAFAGDRWKPI